MEELKVESKTISLKEIPDNSNKKIEIPRYQRPYTWTNKEIEALFNDIKNSIMKSYYIGSIYIMEDGNIQLLDGQQRMTTLFLFLVYLSNNGLITEELERIYRINGKWRMIFQNNLFMYGLHLIKKADITKTTERNIFNAYNKIQKLFDNLTQEEKNKFIYKIGNISITLIKIPKNSNPYVIFNSLNNRGVSLNMGDTIKNILLSTNDTDPDLLLSRWKKLSEEIDTFNSNAGTFYEKVLKDYHMYIEGKTKAIAISSLENKINIFKKKNGKKLGSEYKLALEVIKNYTSFTSNLKYAYNVEKDITKRLKKLTQKERVANMWKHTFKDDKFIQIKPLAHMVIGFFDKNKNEEQLIKTLYKIFIIKKYFELTSVKANIFEKSIKKKVHKDKTEVDFSKRLTRFIKSNDMIKKIINVLESEISEYKDESSLRYNTKEFIYISNLARKNFKNNINTFTWEHINGISKDKNSFFLLEEKINGELSKVKNPSDEQKHNEYKRSVLAFPKYAVSKFKNVQENPELKYYKEVIINLIK